MKSGVVMAWQMVVSVLAGEGNPHSCHTSCGGDHLNDKAPGGAGRLALVVRLLCPALDVSAGLLADLPYRGA